jgi:hypothetical protein
VLTIKAKLVEYAEDFNGYTTYIFENLENTCWDNKYFMCIRYPNWDHEAISIESPGYLTITLIEAGTKYYEPRTGDIKVYTFTHYRFDKFILIQDRLVDDKIVV